MQLNNGFLYIGIDPGASGAIAWCSDQVSDMKVRKCPSGVNNMINSVREIRQSFLGNPKTEILVGIEKVWARPTNAVRAAFKFGINYGQWLAILASEGLDSVHYITPREWQKGIGIKARMEKADRKREIKKKMAKVFPDIKVTLINADAIAITKYLAEKN